MLMKVFTDCIVRSHKVELQYEMIMAFVSGKNSKIGGMSCLPCHM